MRRSAAIIRAVGASVALVLLFAICETSPASAAQRASGDFIYVSLRGTVDPGGSSVLAVSCPDGSRAVGAGGSVGEGVRLALAIPFDGSDGDGDEDDGAKVEGFNDSVKSRAIKGYVVCSRGSDVAQLTYNRESTNVTAASSAASSNVGCAGALQEPLGGGAGTTANLYDRMSKSVPSVAGWDYGIRGVNPIDRSMRGAVVCLPVAARDVTVKQKDIEVVDPGQKVTVRINCPPGTRVTGGGGGSAVYHITRSVPIDGTDGDRTPDDGWSLTARNEDNNPQSLNARAVCAGPALP